MKNFIEQQLRLSFAFFNLVLNREGVGGVKKITLYYPEGKTLPDLSQ